MGAVQRSDKAPQMLRMIDDANMKGDHMQPAAAHLTVCMIFFIMMNWAGPTRAAELPDLPEHARLVLSEDWSSGEIDQARWYVPRRHWGQGNRLQYSN